jgi:hypothetical protein
VWLIQVEGREVCPVFTSLEAVANFSACIDGSAVLVSIQEPAKFMELLDECLRDDPARSAPRLTRGGCVQWRCR